MEFRELREDEYDPEFPDWNGPVIIIDYTKFGRKEGDSDEKED